MAACGEVQVLEGLAEAQDGELSVLVTALDHEPRYLEPGDEVAEVVWLGGRTTDAEDVAELYDLADALDDEPLRLALTVALFFADRREEAGADETTESRASSIGKIEDSRIG